MRFLLKDRIFQLLVLVVVVVQFLLLSLVLEFGLTSEDSWVLFDYKVVGQNVNFLSKYLITLRAEGLHHTYQVISLGILDDLFKGNYQGYQFAGIFFKILATVSLYPLILVVFKRKLLAFLTTLFYALSYSSSGAFLYVCIYSDYLAIFFMNIFLLSYYYYIILKKAYLIYVSMILLFLCFMFSPIRMYPLLLFVMLIEVFIWMRTRTKFNFLNPLLRLIILFFPFALLLYFVPGLVTAGHQNGPSTVYYFLSHGNYQLLLSPFAGIGYTFLTNDYWAMFGNLNLDSFSGYLLFLFRGPVIVYTILTILFGWLVSKRPLIPNLTIILTNFVFWLVCYFFITNVRGMNGPDIKSFYAVSTFAVFFGFFVISVAVSSLVIWWKRFTPSTLLLALFIGPIFSSVFYWGTWIIKGEVLTFKEGIHWYMVAPSIGSSLFLAALMVVAFDKIKIIPRYKLKFFLFGLLFFAIMPVYLISSREINKTFTDLLNKGYRASDQEEWKNMLLSFIGHPLSGNITLFYFDTQDQEHYYPIPFTFGFEQRMMMQNWGISEGCVGLIYDRNILYNSIVIRNGVKGLNVGSLCVSNSFTVSRQEVFYTMNNFYAFKLKDKEILNIKQQVIEEAGLK